MSVHRFRQTGELNPPEVFDYKPYNYSYIGIHVDSAKGLAMMAARDEGLNLFVSLEWAGQVYVDGNCSEASLYWAHGFCGFCGALDSCLFTVCSLN